MRCIQQSRSGFALSIVLWIVASLLLGVAFIVSISKNDLELTKKLHDKLDTRLEAESVLEALKFAILTSDYDSTGLLINQNLPYPFPKKIILDGRKYQITKEISISLQDASSMLDIRNPYSDIIASLISHNNRELKLTIEDSIKDWIDRDDFVRLNGAETSYYKKNKDYKPRNVSALQSVSEIRLIHGLDRLSNKDWQNLQKYLIYFDGEKINLGLIDKNYLKALLKLDDFQFQNLKKHQTSNFQKYILMIRKNPFYDNDYMGFTLSFKIKIGIIVKNRIAISKLNTLVNFRVISEQSPIINKYESY